MKQICAFWNAKKNRCSAIKQDGFCPQKECPFFKTREELERSKKKSRERLLKLGWKPEWIDDYEKYVNSSSERKENKKC